MATRKRAARKPDTGSVEHVLERGELPVSQLLEMSADYNPRTISDTELAALRRSIRFFGFVEPVVVNRRTNRIVGGHQRIKAAQQEEIVTAPVVYVDLDEPSEMQLNLALNRISGEWDDAKLRELLAQLDQVGADLALTGFSDDELAQILVKGTTEAPDEFATPDEDTEHVCPRCGYRWNGRSSLGADVAAGLEDEPQMEDPQ